MKKFVTLVLAVLMIAAMVVSASAAVKPADKPIATIQVNTGAVYMVGYHTILTRIGDSKTVGEITAAIGGSAKDYNWFYVYVVEADESGNYVITRAVNDPNLLGRDADNKPKQGQIDIECPENGFLLCFNANDQTNQANFDTSVGVGKIVVLEGVNLTELSALETGEFIGSKDEIASKDVLAGVATATIYNAVEAEESAPAAEESTPEAEESAPAAEESKGEDENPATGDATMVFALIALVTVAGAVVVARKRVR